MAWNPKKQLEKTIKGWSFSRWKVWSTCALKAKFKFVDKLEEPGSEHMDRGNWFHAMGEAYVSGVVPPLGYNEKPRDKTYTAALANAAKGKLPVELSNFKEEFTSLRAKKYVTEQQWCFRKDWTVTTYDDWDNVWLRVKIDAHKLTGTKLVGVDYKTGKRREDEHSETLDLYALACFKMYPLLEEVVFALWYMDEKDVALQEMVNEYTRADLAGLQKTWERRAAQMLLDQRFAPSPSRLCGWCHFRQSNGGQCKHG